MWVGSIWNCEYIPLYTHPLLVAAEYIYLLSVFLCLLWHMFSSALRLGRFDLLLFPGLPLFRHESECVVLLGWLVG